MRCQFFLYYVFKGLGPRVPQGGPRDPPRVPPGSNLLQNGSQNDSKIIKNLTCRLSENASQRHAHWACFQIALGLFLVCSYSCRGRLFCVTFIQVKSRHSSAWLGGKTYGGCLPDASRCVQMPSRCLPDASRCFPDASRCLPDASQMSPDVCDASPMMPAAWCFLHVFIKNSCLGSYAWVMSFDSTSLRWSQAHRKSGPWGPWEKQTEQCIFFL